MTSPLRRVSDYCPDPRVIPAGFCHCGCGQQTRMASRNDESRGWVKGEPLRYVHRHGTTKGNTGTRNYVVVAESVLGKKLPRGAEVHHVDQNRQNNRPSNLVICQDGAYHRLLHTRLNALRGCGDPGKRRCCYCHQWDDVANLLKYKSTRSMRHRSCGNTYALIRSERMRARALASS